VFNTADWRILIFSRIYFIPAICIKRNTPFVYLKSENLEGTGCFMKRLVYVAILLLVHIAASAQLGNEWINFTAPYYKIPVGKDGLYRLNRTQLLGAGVPSFVDPKTIKLFHRGIEQSIYVEGEGDSQLNASDFVEFYGRKNDGTLDQKLYPESTSQPHTFYNLYSDTTSYFLTYGGSVGKRSSVAAQSTANPAETFHWDEKFTVYHDQFSGGVDYGEVQIAAFDKGEGWMSVQIVQGGSSDFVINGITNGNTGVGVPKLEIMITGRGSLTHNIEIAAGARVLSNVSIAGYNSLNVESDLQWADISPSGQLTIRVGVTGVGTTPARASVGYIRITYPQILTFDGAVEKHFTLNENVSGASNVKIQSPPVGAVVYDVTDPNSVLRIPSTQGATLDVVVGQTVARRKLFSSNTFVTPSIKRVSFRQINPSAQDYVIITHAALRKPVAGYTDPVKAYGEYRSLPQGGSYDTMIVNIDQLYNQFSYGEQTPLAIYNFLKYLKTGKLPNYLLLVGKGLRIDYGYYRAPGAYPQFKDLVPTAGSPPSDMLYSHGLSGTPGVAAVATGRLSAAGPADVAAYLNKVKEFESQPFDNLRKKNILHLSGGLYAGEPQQFRAYLEAFAVVAKSVHLGGKVKAIAKQSTDIEVINVADEVNQGLNLITLFGHSSPSSADFDIGMVTDPLMGYNNKGKYPALLLNGCLAGSYFLNAAIFGENWTNTPDRGAIGVIAHSNFGFAFYLRSYSDYFYKVAYADSAFINKGLADVQNEISKRFLADNLTSVYTVSQVEQMVLLGDPAVSLFGATKPDYAIDENSISLQTKDGSKVSAFSDSLVLKFTINNFGVAKKKKIRVNVQRSLNDNSLVEYDTLIDATLYSDTISFSFPGRVDKGFGNNSFSITIDSDESIEELNEDNNSYSRVFFIPLSGTKNLYPDNYAIVSSRNPVLSFQHTDQLSGEREFVLEIDTVKDFNSAFHQAFNLKGKVLASKKVDLLVKDSLVYYWRTKLAQPDENESTAWEQNSFTYINNGPSGWTQIQYSQLEENFTERLEKNSGSKKIEFEETVTSVDVIAYGDARTELSSVKVNGAEMNLYNEENNFMCRDNTINLIAFDKTSTQPYAGLYFTWIEIRDIFSGRTILCGREPYVINSFMSNEVSMGLSGDLIQYIENIAEGDSVLLFTIGDAGIASWAAEAKTKIGELGVSVSQLDQIQAGEPVVIFARKGAPAGTAKIYRSENSPAVSQSVAVNTTVTGRQSEGKMNSGLIGPASSWNEFVVKYTTDNGNDVVAFTIEGVTLSGQPTTLFENITDDVILSSIDADQYPYLRIVYSTQDETFVTAAQLNRWMVIFEPVAEGLLLFDGAQTQQTVSEGQVWSGDYRFVNLSEKSFQDSLTVKYEITKTGTSTSTLNDLKIFAPTPGDTTHFTVTFPTRHHIGINDLFVNVNPRVLPENDFDNNFITLPQHLKVWGGSISPLLEVTFDGRHIAQGEFVSPQPDISVVLMDNNPYLFSNDTLDVKLYIQQPCGNEECPFEPVYFSDPEITWSAETVEDDFEIHYTPDLDKNGLYTLRVIASDVSGNLSGAEPFEISFNVAHENTVTLHEPYPNPFNYRTNFDIEVAGETLPDQTELKVFNTRGELVRVFKNDSFSGLHFGNNIFSWEGLNQNGVPVPNGIYIFKLKVKSADKVSEKAGKLVLVR
jgi:hypothetical protein